jgi:hypothetical protein
MMMRTLTIVQTDTKELRTDLLGLVAKTLEKTQEDMANFIKMADKSDEKEAEFERKIKEMEKSHELELTSKTAENNHRDIEKDKAFYRKLIIACFTIGATIILTFFGIKALIPIF